jgi:hypothetical protein
MEISARCWQDQRAIAIDEFGEDADAVLEAALFLHVIALIL